MDIILRILMGVPFGVTKFDVYTNSFKVVFLSYFVTDKKKWAGRAATSWRFIQYNKKNNKVNS